MSSRVRSLLRTFGASRKLYAFILIGLLSALYYAWSMHPEATTLTPQVVKKTQLSDSDQKHIASFIDRNDVTGPHQILAWSSTDRNVIRNLSNLTRLELAFLGDEIVATINLKPRLIYEMVLWEGATSDGDRVAVAYDKSEDIFNISISGHRYIREIPSTDYYIAFKEQPQRTKLNKHQNSGSDAEAGLVSSCRLLREAPLNQTGPSIDVVVAVSPHLIRNRNFGLDLRRSMGFLHEFADQVQQQTGQSIHVILDETLTDLDISAAQEDELLTYLETLPRNGRQSPSLKSFFKQRIASADLILYVMQFGESSTWHGRAELIPANERDYIAIIDASKLQHETLFAHELSHLLGARHEAHLDTDNSRVKAWRWGRQGTKVEDFFTWLFARQEISSDASHYEGTVSAEHVAERLPILSDSRMICGRGRNVAGDPHSALQADTLAPDFARIARLSNQRSALAIALERVPTRNKVNVTDVAVSGGYAIPGAGSGADGATKEKSNPPSLEEGPAATPAPTSLDTLCQAMRFRHKECAADPPALGSVHFARGVWGLSDLQRKQIAGIFETYESHVGTLVVAGHASASGQLSANYLLSRKRATVVANALEEFAKRRGENVDIRICVLGPDIPHCGKERNNESMNQRATVRVASATSRTERTP